MVLQEGLAVPRDAVVAGDGRERARIFAEMAETDTKEKLRERLDRF